MVESSRFWWPACRLLAAVSETVMMCKFMELLLIN